MAVSPPIPYYTYYVHCRKNLEKFHYYLLRSTYNTVQKPYKFLRDKKYESFGFKMPCIFLTVPPPLPLVPPLVIFPPPPVTPPLVIPPPLAGQGWGIGCVGILPLAYQGLGPDFLRVEDVLKTGDGI